MSEEKEITLTDEARAAVVRSMTRAGIPQKYHSGKSLKDFGKAGKLILDELDQKDFLYSVSCGRGFTIHGHKPDEAYDLAVYTARAMRIMQLDIRVVNLLGLAEFIEAEENDDTRFQNFDAVKGLMITRFFEPMDGLPISRSLLYKVENFLFSKLEAGVSISVQFTGKLENSKWWSEYFLAALKNSNREIFIR